ncbi:MAG: Arc family DNA-binding protein [Verrucomicrobiota bacterium]
MTITLKDIPSRLHRELKSRALAHGRSLNTEVIACLESGVHSSVLDVESVLRSARSVRSSIKVRLTSKDLVSFKNEGRP